MPEADSRNAPADVQASVGEELDAWRRRATDAFTLVSAALHLMVLIPLVAASHLRPPHALGAAAAWLLTVAATLLRRLPVGARVWLLSGAAFLYTGAMLARGGVFLGFRAAIVLFPMVVVMLAGVRRGLVVGALMFLFATAASGATEAGWLPDAPPPWSPGEWVMQAAGTVGMALPCLLLLAWFSHHLTSSIRREVVTAQRLRAEAEDRERLEGEVLEAGERESQRIGSDLHDGVCQDLTGLLLRSKRAQMALTTAARPEAEALAGIVEGLSEAIGEVHGLSRRLSPGRLTARDLAGALADLARRTSEVSEAAVIFRAEGEAPPAGPQATLQLYRIAQEALANAVRHAGATRIEVALVHDADATTLTVDDDGLGLPEDAEERDGLGLGSMRWRATKVGGVLRLGQRPGGGTRIECCVPRAELGGADERRA